MTADLHALLDTDPAAGLRGVAALMRSRAEAAMAIGGKGGWSVHETGYTVLDGDGIDVCTRAAGVDAAHIAAADPPFVLAVADWLDKTAENVDRTSLYARGIDCEKAIATARAYVGRQ